MQALGLTLKSTPVDHLLYTCKAQRLVAAEQYKKIGCKLTVSFHPPQPYLINHYNQFHWSMISSHPLLLTHSPFSCYSFTEPTATSFMNSSPHFPMFTLTSGEDNCLRTVSATSCASYVRYVQCEISCYSLGSVPQIGWRALSRWVQMNLTTVLSNVFLSGNQI